MKSFFNKEKLKKTKHKKPKIQKPKKKKNKVNLLNENDFVEFHTYENQKDILGILNDELNRVLKVKTDKFMRNSPFFDYFIELQSCLSEYLKA